MEEINIKKATIINFFSKYSNIFIQLLLNSILARLLTPDDYGIVAIITVFISFFTVIADMGIGPAIIQHKDLSKKQISDIFIFTVFVGLLVSIGFILFSYPLAMFYDNRVYIPLGIILSIGIFFNVINMVPNALLLKDKQFKALGIRTVVITIVGGIITIILAIKGAKYYALVVNSVFVGFLTFVFNYWYSKINIYWGFSLESIKKIKEFSSYQFGFNFINYFSRNSDNLLIGKFMGEVALGYYDKAYRLMLYPVQNLTHVITPVLHPILSDYQDDYDKIYNQYVKVAKILSLLGVFILVFCFFSAKEIILIMFGKQWLQSVESFKILSLSIWIQMLMSSTGSIFQSTGQTKLLFRCGIVTTIINVSAIIIGVMFKKIEYVAVLIVIAFSFNFIITFYYLIKKSMNRSLRKFFREFYSSFIIMIIMIIGFIVIPVKLPNIILNILCKLLLGGIMYILGLIITKEYKAISRLIKK